MSPLWQKDASGQYCEDLRAAVEDVVAFCTYLKNYYRNLQQGATSQLLVLCNRTAVHNLLLQHGFQSAWYGGLRVSTTSSAAGATARIAVIVQTEDVGMHSQEPLNIPILFRLLIGQA